MCGTTLAAYMPVGAGVPSLPQILANQLSQSQPWGTDYAHQITATPPPGFLDPPKALHIEHGQWEGDTES